MVNKRSLSRWEPNTIQELESIPILPVKTALFWIYDNRVGIDSRIVISCASDGFNQVWGKHSGATIGNGFVAHNAEETIAEINRLTQIIRNK